MELNKISKLLKEARFNAGVKAGKTWKDGRPKPLTQKEAADLIGISCRKLQDVENQIANFANIHAEKRALDFIVEHSGVRKQEKDRRLK